MDFISGVRTSSGTEVVEPSTGRGMNKVTPTIHKAFQRLHQRLSSVTDTPAMDSYVLLAHLLGKPREWIMAHPEAILSPDELQAVENTLDRIDQGEPLPYILGLWEFFRLEFELSPATLIPRPETELLVEAALEWLNENPDRKLAADVGTGSGIIATSLAVHIPDLSVIASDISYQTLHTARQNASKHFVSGQVSFILADLLPPLSRPFDLICANLPYIPSNILFELKVSKREPRLALDGGPRGLEVITKLLSQIRSSKESLAPGGLILLEIESTQGKAVSEIAQRLFPNAHIDLLTDLGGKDRLLSIQIPPG